MKNNGIGGLGDGVGDTSYRCNLLVRGIFGTVIVPDFERAGFNMGGVVDTGRRIPRYKPCFQPFYGLYIDYHGYVMPCCALRYEIDEHKYAVLGNIQDHNIFELWCGEKMVNFRRQVRYYGPKVLSCQYCDIYNESEIKL